MDINKVSIEIGLEKPVKLLHITDTHLSYADERDDERKRKLAIDRQKTFNDANDRILSELVQMIEYGNQNCDMIVHTGDLIDFISAENLEKARWAMDKADNLLFIAGNHEFSRYVGEAWEDIAYKMTNYQYVHHFLKTDLLFSSREVGGVNVVGVDNGYYHFEKWQLWRLKREVEKGLPIVLMMHNPLCMPVEGEKLMGVVGCDEEYLLDYPEYRAVQQRPTQETLEFIDYINEEPLIKCVLSGHLHKHYEGTLESGKRQIITGLGSDGVMSEITLY